MDIGVPEGEMLHYISSDRRERERGFDYKPQMSPVPQPHTFREGGGTRSVEKKHETMYELLL